MVERVITAFDGGKTAFDEMSVVEFTPLIELDSANGLSALRDVQTVTGSGSIADANGEIQLSTGATASSTAQLDTAERGRYQPGIEAVAGIAIRRPTSPAGNQFWEAGYFDDNDGYWVGEDASGVYVRMRQGGTDRAKVYQSEWEFGAAITLNLKRTTVFRFPFLCYYGGPLRIEAEQIDDHGVSHLRALHSFAPVDGEPILQQSKLPIRGKVDNGGDASDLSIFVGGRHFAVRGRYAPNRRQTPDYKLAMSTNTTDQAMVSFRKKSGDTAKSVKVSGLAVLSDTNSLISVYLSPTLGADNFGSVSDIPDSETSVESDTTTTTINDPGQCIDRTLISGGSGNRSNLAGIRRLGLDIPDDTIVTLAIRTISGTGTASAVFTLEEEW